MEERREGEGGMEVVREGGRMGESGRKGEIKREKEWRKIVGPMFRI